MFQINVKTTKTFNIETQLVLFINCRAESIVYRITMVYFHKVLALTDKAQLNFFD